MSEIKTNKISPRSGTTQTIGDSGDSVSTSGGSTITNAGSITTAGITGGTINNTTGDIFLRGEVDWKPGDIKTTSFTPSPNEGYFLNTTSGQITITLPASPSVGDVIGIKDYANTFDSNSLSVDPNGSEKINGGTGQYEINYQGITLNFDSDINVISANLIANLIKVKKNANLVVNIGGQIQLSTVELLYTYEEQ